MKFFPESHNPSTPNCLESYCLRSVLILHELVTSNVAVFGSTSPLPDGPRYEEKRKICGHDCMSDKVGGPWRPRSKRQFARLSGKTHCVDISQGLFDVRYNNRRSSKLMSQKQTVCPNGIATASDRRSKPSDWSWSGSRGIVQFAPQI